MTATQTQIRRDTATNLNAATPASGELGYDQTNKRIVIGDGLTAGGIKLPNYNDIQRQSFTMATAAGTADAIVLTLSPPLISYSNARVVFKATATNANPVTININSIGVVNIYKMANGALSVLAAGDIRNGGIYEIFYDGTQFQIKAIDESTPQTAGMTLLALVSGAGSSYDFTDFSSDFDDYLFVISGFKNATSSVGLQLRCSTNAGASYDSSNNYSYAINRVRSTPNAAALGSDSTSAAILFPTGESLAGTLSGHVYASDLNGSFDKIFNSQVTGYHTGNPLVTMCNAGNHYANGSVVNGIRFMPTFGSISDGKILMYGLDKTL